jgi:hypothetical protein
MCRLSRNPGALTSRTPQGHVGLFRGYFYAFYVTLPHSAMVDIFAVSERAEGEEEKEGY